MAVLELVLQQIDTFQHLLRVLGAETWADVDATHSLQEDIDYHPVCFVLRLFVLAVTRSQPDELKHILRVYVLAKLLDQLLL